MSTTTSYQHSHDIDYHALLDTVQDFFSNETNGVSVLFTTQAADLWNIYLEGVNEDRQVHNCTACRHFIERYGNLVKVTPEGTLQSVIWPRDVGGFYGKAFKFLAEEVESHKISGVFLSPLPTWGTPETGKWRHFAVYPPKSMIWKSRAQNAGQAMAGMLERRRIVQQALADFQPPELDQALRVLKADAVNRSEKFVAPVQWLRDLHNLPKGRARDNLMWYAIATAPEGYCHPRSAVTGTLLEDIKEGLDFEIIRKRFNEKVHPLAYQRPTAAPTSGNIKRAEKLIEDMGLAPALERRFAALDDLTLWWTPNELTADKKPSKGVFSHLKPKDLAEVKSVDLPKRTMTWEKFKALMLDNETADELQLLIPTRGHYVALTAPVNADAPSLFKWDNTLAWYVYPSGSHSHQWGLTPTTWATVTGISDFPTMYGNQPQTFISGTGCILILEGCVDQGDAGNGLFPECLKNELHEVRATIEAYSKSAKLEGRESASACGWDVRAKNFPFTIRAKVKGAREVFTIDRMD